MVLGNIISRVIKCNFREKMREAMKEAKGYDEPIRKLLTRLLNLVFANTSQSSKYWEEVIVKELEEKFNLSKEVWVYEGKCLFPSNLKKYYFEYPQDSFKTKYYLISQLQETLIY